MRIEVSVGAVRSVCVSLVNELKRHTYYIPALSTASAITHRLSHLLPPPTPDTVTETDRESMFSEATRLNTFLKWPHMNYK